MTYSITIERRYSDSSYIINIKKWEEVINTLKNKLDTSAIKVHVYKWSSNSKCIGYKCVTMGNFWEVVNSKTDKILKG